MKEKLGNLRRLGKLGKLGSLRSLRNLRKFNDVLLNSLNSLNSLYKMCSRCAPYHKKLEEVARINVESTIAVLTLDEWVATELADRKTVLEGYDKVLIHNKAKTCANGDMWAV